MKSIKMKFFAYFIGIVTLVFLIFWFGVNFYIEGYYYGQKVNEMRKTIKIVENTFKVSGSEYDALTNLEYLGYNFEGKISIHDDNSVIVITDDNNLQYARGKIVKRVSYKGTTAYIYETSYPVSGAKWLMYAEELYNGKIALLQIPIEAIDTTLNIIRTFFKYLAIISVILAIIFALFLSNNITKPVTQLNQVAKEMGKLNFDKKYTGKRRDEIGQLGQTLNSITIKLEKTINDLQYELNKEKQLDVLRKKFVAQVSHELQTPLSIINGYIEALEDNVVESEEERQDYYNIIQDETGKMSKMVKDLLDLSQLEAGTFKINKEEVDISNIIDLLANKYDKLTKSRNIIYNYIGLKDSNYIMGDSLRLEQAFSNILGNALKHTKENGNIIFKGIKLDDKIKITIENEGTHIPESEISLIWESFYKAKTSEKKDGTGLGLAIASYIFKYHNIDYRVYNTKLGVCFEFIIDTQ
jgi:signal transduction histidine kinase